MRAVYAQIDDQLWDQMVALPLFGEPGLVASGVQVANAGYNPSVDGVLWNVAEWTLLRARTAEWSAVSRRVPSCFLVPGWSYPTAGTALVARYHALRPDA